MHIHNFLIQSRARAALSGFTLRFLEVALLVLMSACDSSVVARSVFPGTGGAQNQLTKLSFDPYDNFEGQHETAMKTNIVIQGNTLVVAYQVGQLENGGVTNIGWAASNDSGSTWKQGTLPNTTVFAGGSMNLVADPVVEYDAKHGVWLISYVGFDFSQNINAVYVSISRDGANSWSNPVRVVKGDSPNKEWIVCDNYSDSAYYGSCYIEYNENQDSAVYLTRSGDGGETWEAPKRTADLFAGTAGQPIVLPGGRAVVPIANPDFTRLYFFYSDDGGVSWSDSSLISVINTSPPRAALRAVPNPSVTIDSTGKLYLSWYDCRFEPGCRANGLVVSTSSDGLTWSKPKRINTFPIESNVDHLFPSLGADLSTSASKIGLVFYGISAGACVSKPTDCQIDAYYSASHDEGKTWSSLSHLGGPMKPDWISTTSCGRMIGDYIGVAFLGGVAFPAFSLALQPTIAPYHQGIYTRPQRIF